MKLTKEDERRMHKIMDGRLDLGRFVVNYSGDNLVLGDLEVLLRYANGVDLFVELGTCIGTTATIISRVAKKVVTVDIFENIELIPDKEKVAGYTQFFRRYTRTYAYMKKEFSKYAPNVVVYQDLTYKLATSFDDESVDVVFVDGDHSFSGVQLDFIAWKPKVKINGVLLFHDVGQGNPGVLQLYTDVLSFDEDLQELPTLPPGQTSIRAFRRLS